MKEQLVTWFVVINADLIGQVLLFLFFSFSCSFDFDQKAINFIVLNFPCSGCMLLVDRYFK